MTGITGINGFIGGCLYGYFQQSLIEAVGLSTDPKFPRVVRLKDGVPQEALPGTDSIVHCGGLVGDGFKPEEYKYANVECTERLLAWCEKNGVRHFVLFSTGGVYGGQAGWVDETAALDPKGPYSESKVLAEEAVARSSVPVKTVIRLYFPIGSLRYKHLFSRLANSLREKNEVFLNDEQGHPRISPVWTDDVCRVIAEVLRRKLGGTYNLSANAGITIGEIVETMSGLLGINPTKHVRNVASADFLGKADKIIAATGVGSLTPPRDALRRVFAEIPQVRGPADPAQAGKKDGI
jgi:nucleoside-diphosphate-sugar epimerase